MLVLLDVTVCADYFYVAKEPSDKWWRFADFFTGAELRRSSYRSDQTFLTAETTEGVQHAEEVKVAAERNEEPITANNFTTAPESISSQTSPSQAHPSPTPASTSTSEGGKEDTHKSHSDGKGKYKYLFI